jgi:hypothetical protein
MRENILKIQDMLGLCSGNGDLNTDIVEVATEQYR